MEVTNKCILFAKPTRGWTAKSAAPCVCEARTAVPTTTTKTNSSPCLACYMIDSRLPSPLLTTASVTKGTSLSAPCTESYSAKKEKKSRQLLLQIIYCTSVYDWPLIVKWSGEIYIKESPTKMYSPKWKIGIFRKISFQSDFPCAKTCCSQSQLKKCE